MALQRGKPQQARQLSVARIAHQELARNCGKHLKVASTRVQNCFDLLTPPARIALLFNDGPIELFLAGKMAEEQRFIDSGALSDLARRRPAVAAARKQAGSGAHDLPAAVQS